MMRRLSQMSSVLLLAALSVPRPIATPEPRNGKIDVKTESQLETGIGTVGHPYMTGLVHCPTFAPTGELHAEYGYHSATPLFNACALPIGQIRLTTANVQAAKHLLVQDLLVDFPFDSQASLAHALALVLLPFVRPLIDGRRPSTPLMHPHQGRVKACWPTLVPMPLEVAIWRQRQQLKMTMNGANA
jgi:hypothetical protein